MLNVELSNFKKLHKKQNQILYKHTQPKTEKYETWKEEFELD